MAVTIDAEEVLNELAATVGNQAKELAILKVRLRLAEGQGHQVESGGSLDHADRDHLPDVQQAAD